MVGQIGARAIAQVDKVYKRTVVKVNKTKKRYTSTFNNGLVGTAQSRFDKKVKILQKLLRRAEITNDHVWRRLIRRQLKKLIGVDVGI